MNKKVLYKFFEGTATFNEEVEVREWMESSTTNHDKYFRERKLFDLMLLGGNSKADKFKKIININRTPTYIKNIAKIAAIVAITFTVSLFYQQFKLEKIYKSVNLISVPAGQRVNLTLPDGTNVWLNSRSTLQYPALFSGNTREVKLDGEAYFNVKHDGEKPFIVNTQKYNIRVLGTKFNVDSYSNIGNFSTALIEGSVKIIDKKNTANEIVLLPDNKAFLKNEQLEISTINNYDDYRWKDGLICFKDIKFSELMIEFEKCYGFRILINNKQVEDFECSGKFRQSDGIDYALRVLQSNTHFTFTRDADSTIIYIN